MTYHNTLSLLSDYQTPGVRTVISLSYISNFIILDTSLMWDFFHFAVKKAA